MYAFVVAPGSGFVHPAACMPPCVKERSQSDDEYTPYQSCHMRRWLANTQYRSIPFEKSQALTPSSGRS